MRLVCCKTMRCTAVWKEGLRFRVVSDWVGVAGVEGVAGLHFSSVSCTGDSAEYRHAPQLICLQPQFLEHLLKRFEVFTALTMNNVLG
jgi:hypothetical protein